MKNRAPRTIIVIARQKKVNMNIYLNDISNYVSIHYKYECSLKPKLHIYLSFFCRRYVSIYTIFKLRTVRIQTWRIGWHLSRTSDDIYMVLYASTDFRIFFCRPVQYNMNLTCCLYSLTTKQSTEEFYFWMLLNETCTLITRYKMSFNKSCLLSVSIKTRLCRYNFYVYFKTWVYSPCTILTLACGIC